MKLPDFNIQQQVGCTAAAVILSIGVALGLTVMNWDAADLGDRLSFAGALGGSAITVFGAVMISELRRLRAVEEAEKLLLHLLQEVFDEIERIERSEPVDGFDRSTVILGNVDLLNEAITRAKEATRWLTPTTTHMIKAFHHIQRIEVDKEAIRKELRPLTLYPVEAIVDLRRHLGPARNRAALAQDELSR